MKDLSRKEAEEALYEGVNGLFAAHKDAEGDQIGPYAAQYAPYVVFANGQIKPESAPCARSPTRRDSIRDTIDMVKKTYAHAHLQTVVWRRRPELHAWKDYNNPALGLSTKAGWAISIRIAALDPVEQPQKTWELEPG